MWRGIVLIYRRFGIVICVIIRGGSRHAAVGSWNPAVSSKYDVRYGSHLIRLEASAPWLQGLVGVLPSSPIGSSAGARNWSGGQRKTTVAVGVEDGDEEGDVIGLL